MTGIVIIGTPAPVAPFKIPAAKKAKQSDYVK